MAAGNRLGRLERGEWCGLLPAHSRGPADRSRHARVQWNRARCTALRVLFRSERQRSVHPSSRRNARSTGELGEILTDPWSERLGSDLDCV